jgi:glycosyltransferase involved in cell wall biosynthesis
MDKHKKFSHVKEHRIAYVSPIFPALSAVFEQNEILGLIDQCDKLVLYSCRRVPDRQSALHDFARPIQNVFHYFKPTQYLAVIFYFSLRYPLRIAKVVLLYVKGVITQPSRIIPHTACLLLGISFAFHGRNQDFTWVHADFAQGSATVAWYIAILLSIPFSFKAHAYDIYFNESSTREKDSFFRAKLKNAKKIFVVHQFGLKLLIESYPDCGVREKGVINRVSIRPGDAAKVTRQRDGRNTIRFVALGRLAEKKGFDVLVESLARLQSPIEWTCEIWGSGEEEELLKSKVRSLGLIDKVRLKGVYDQGQLPEIMGEADLLLVPSKKARDGDMDGIPTVIFEAMLFRVPVLSTRLSGIPEVIENGKTGWLVDPDDPDALAECIARIFQDTSVIEDIVSRAYQYVITEHDYRKLSKDLVAAMT